MRHGAISVTIFAYIIIRLMKNVSEQIQFNSHYLYTVYRPLKIQMIMIYDRYIRYISHMEFIYIMIPFMIYEWLQIKPSFLFAKKNSSFFHNFFFFEPHLGLH